MSPASFLLLPSPWPFLLLLLLISSCFLLLRKPKLHFPSLQNKHVLITGGSSGIGFAIALECLRQGASVTLVARNPDRLSRAAELLRTSFHPPPPSLHHRLLVKVADVTDPDAVSSAIAESFSWKPIDILVCNAGIATFSEFPTAKICDLEMTTKINFLGCVYTIHAALPLMKTRSENHPCSIVITGSLSGLVFVNGIPVYAATKHALKGLAEVLRYELLSDNIKVSLVCPNFTKTPLLEPADETFWKANKIFFLDKTSVGAASVVAARTMQGVKEGKYLITTNQLTGLITRVIGRGWTPAECPWDALIELLLLVPVRIVTLFWFPLARWMMKKHQQDLKCRQ